MDDKLGNTSETSKTGKEQKLEDTAGHAMHAIF